MTTSDLVLLAYIVLIVPAMLVGFVFARRKMFEPYHKLTMTTITLVNWALIIGVMLVTYRRDVVTQLPQNIGFPAVLIPTLHLIPGLIAQIIATYLVIRMWFENQLPDWFKVKNIKIYMRTTLALWLLTAVLGALTWAVINKGFLASAEAVPPANVAAGTTVIRMVSGNKFDPVDLKITTGTKVQFINADTKPHTVAADDGSFDSGSLKPGATFEFTFNKPGDVKYYCDFHGAAGGSGMSAVLHVEGAAIAEANTPVAAATSVATVNAAAPPATTNASSAAEAVIVTLNDDEFAPKSLNVPVGTLVRFVNKGVHKHTVTADDDSFDSGQLKAGATFEFTFTKAGDVPLYCANHGDKGGQGMSMVVHVGGGGNVATPNVGGGNVATPNVSSSAATVNAAAPAATTNASSAAEAVIVTLNDDEFAPKSLNVPVGTLVRFVNKGAHKHTVTADDDSFDSGQLKAGAIFEFTFIKAGDVPLYCANHGDKGGKDMSMVVHVGGSGGAAATPNVSGGNVATPNVGSSAATPNVGGGAALDPKLVTAMQPLVISADDTPNKTPYLVGAQSQMAIVAKQSAALTDALKQAHYEDAQAAAEALVNTIEGDKGADLDQDGKINQPGDAYGLRKYIFGVNEADGLPVDIQTGGRDAVKDLQNVKLQAQAVLDAKTLVDARKAEPLLDDAVTKLNADVTKMVSAAVALNVPSSKLTP
ncbi:MAG: cupredoxin domain-containing protein [Chloroflexota bacterium]